MVRKKKHLRNSKSRGGQGERGIRSIYSGGSDVEAGHWKVHKEKILKNDGGQENRGGNGGEVRMTEEGGILFN